MKRNKIIEIFKSFEIDTHIGPEMLNAIADKIIEADERDIEQYPDTEAGGFVFCGKCGKTKD